LFANAYVTDELLSDNLTGDPIKVIERYQMMVCEQLEAKALGLPDPYPELTAWCESLPYDDEPDDDDWGD
jgi:hypothetical protein